MAPRIEVNAKDIVTGSRNSKKISREDREYPAYAAPGKRNAVPSDSKQAPKKKQKTKKDDGDDGGGQQDIAQMFGILGRPKAAKDASKPDGEAVDENGRLKDASEIQWQFDPDDPVPPAASEDEGEPEVPAEEDNSGEYQEEPKEQENENEENENAGDGEEEEDDEDDEAVEETEDEGEKRYNALIMAQGKPKPRKTHATQDLRAFFDADVRKVNGVQRAGWYCTLCLEKIPDGSNRANAFFTGHVSTRRSHMSRSHYAEYLAKCTEKGWTPKASAPKGWKGPDAKTAGGQTSIMDYAAKGQPKAPRPKVTKDGIIEYLIELLVDADLSFRFVDRPSFRRFCLYLNPKLEERDLPHKSCLADSILEKGERLDIIDLNVISKIDSRVSLVYDGWTTKNRRPYTAFGLQYIDASPKDDSKWELKSLLLAFEHAPGRHTGKAIGKEMWTVVKKFNFQDKVRPIFSVNELRSSNETARDFFERVCHMVGVEPRKLKLWVRTRWGSLNDCLESGLDMRKAIDSFCDLADSEESLPPLRSKKKWSNFKLQPSEWHLIGLARDVLKVAADLHADLSAQKSPTLQRVYPLIEKLMSQWEQMAKKPKYAPLKHAIQAGLENMYKWYRKTDDSSAYFIAHLFDPVWKDRYVGKVWEKKYLDKAMSDFRETFLDYKYEMDGGDSFSDTSSTSQRERPSSPVSEMSAADEWMAEQMADEEETDEVEDDDPFAELNRYLADKVLARKDCPDPVTWWGCQGATYPVLRKMAKDYLAIPASSCLIERAFSMSARTDDPRRRNIGKVKFGVNQRLRDGYHSGRLKSIEEAWVRIDPDFDFDEYSSEL